MSNSEFVQLQLDLEYPPVEKEITMNNKYDVTYVEAGDTIARQVKADNMEQVNLILQGEAFNLGVEREIVSVTPAPEKVSRVFKLITQDREGAEHTFYPIADSKKQAVEVVAQHLQANSLDMEIVGVEGMS